ncbi:MAG: UDP-N-acetylglucosamine--N-acetylmuramyl-(pentapeptide) pyrophosphoryl-undecaprenol N-acetylglucosamine transferase [Candidatus Omnitrophica bacterium]|nr:UDP-N-acetylglucosamine--N-acetylmuramyl-(pentapeptide) pyrophosphoryl-undecaprenol N-acetylglucosamine transferase [Candidatus Omnitrophota bacterium]MDD5429382.1 UDP-N-acetylglucosamine--N-acetylmuramyl-(pentapeptide) pyrophosphoryl-undecaprenol N-acetylglucosamine transferase [Candidatus Omnitrophota bacterium]
MKILLVCERSAGHVFSALGFAQKFLRSGQCRAQDIYFFITAPFLKKEIEDKGFVVLGHGFKHRNFVVEFFWRFIEAVYLLIKIKPAKVIGFGGRDSFFLVILSSIFTRKVYIYEPNLKMGRANMFLRRFSKKVFRGFPALLPEVNEITVGIPLREEIVAVKKEIARQQLGLGKEVVVFCFGGSQGAEFVNAKFRDFIGEYPNLCQVIHITGKRECFKIKQFYNRMGVRSFVKDFYYSVEVLYSAADIVVSRAGALSLGEISFFGLPALLIPHPQGGGHQKTNALYFQERNAARVFLQDGFSFREFKEALIELINNQHARERMSDNSRAIQLGRNFQDFCTGISFGL